MFIIRCVPAGAVHLAGFLLKALWLREFQLKALLLKALPGLVLAFAGNFGLWLGFNKNPRAIRYATFSDQFRNIVNTTATVNERT